MYQVGGGQGQAYKGQEGDGFSSILGASQTASANLWRVNKKERQLKEKETSDRIDQQKALGLIDNLKGEVAIPHNVDIQNEIKGFVGKVGEDMMGMKNPFDLTNPKGRENFSKYSEILNKMKISKNMQDEYDMFERGDHKTTNPEDIAAYRKQFRETPLNDWLSGKVKRVNLRLKNPYETEQSIWQDKDFLAIQNERQQRGIDLVDDESLPALIKDRMQDPNVKTIYQAKYEGLAAKEKKELEARVVAKNATSPQKVSELELLASDFLQGTLPKTPFDKSKVAAELAKRVGDDVNEVEKGITTTKSKNTSKRTEDNIKTKTISFLTSESADAKRARRDYGITISDIANNTEGAKKAIADFSKEVKSSVDTGFSSKQDELRKWEIDKAKGNALDGAGGQMQNWLDRVQSTGDTDISDNAANELIGRNLSWGTEIKEVKIQKGDARVNQAGWIDVEYVDYNDKNTGKPVIKNKRILFDKEHETELANLWQGSPSYGRRKGDVNAGIIKDKSKIDPLGIKKTTKKAVANDPLGLRNGK